MSQGNVEVVREAHRLLTVADFDGLAEIHDPEVVAHPPRGWPEPGPFRGRDTVMRGYRAISRDWEEIVPTRPLEIVATEADWVVVEYSSRVRWSGSGIDTPYDGAGAYRIRQGRIIEIHFCWNREEALKAAGLKE